MKILTQVVRIYNQDIGMEFGMEKFAMLIMKSWKQQMTEGIELPNQEKKKQNFRRNGNWEILENIESGLHQTCGDEWKTKKRILQENEKTARNLSI